MSRLSPRESDSARDSTHPTCAQGSRCMFKTRRAIARAIRAIQSTRPGICAYCACHKTCTRTSKAPCLPRNSNETMESAAPVTQSKLATNSTSSKLLRLPRSPTSTCLRTQPNLARDCGARVISTDFHTFQAHQTEPIVRQGQQKRRQRKHYHAPAKQDTTSGIQIPKARQRGHPAFQKPGVCAAKSLQDSSKCNFLWQSQWHGNFFHMRTLADAFEPLRTLSSAFRTLSATREPTSEHDLTPRPHLISGIFFRYAFKKNADPQHAQSCVSWCEGFLTSCSAFRIFAHWFPVTANVQSSIGC